MEAPTSPRGPAPQELSRYDESQRRQAVRRGRERGAWIFVPAAELRAAGYDPAGPPPFYRVWGRGRGGVLVRLYRSR